MSDPDTDPPPSFDPKATLRELDDATDRLLDTVKTLDDVALGRPAGLPRWSRGHVVSHLSRNADGLSNLARWAATGVESPMYASREAREVDIEAGAGRGVLEQLADLESSAQLLRDLLGGMSGEAGRRIASSHERGRGRRLGDPAAADPRGGGPSRRSCGRLRPHRLE